MRLEQLQYFVQVVESHSFNKAARLLHITQPALSNSVRALEDELGVRLLVRSHVGVLPTEWGVRIYEDCRSLLEDLESKIRSWRPDSQKGGEGPVFVPLVGIPSACNYLTERIIPLMKEELPGIEVVLHEKTAYEMLDFLKEGAVHVAVTAFSEKEEELVLGRYRSFGFHAACLLDDEYYVFLSSEHPLAAADSLSVEECASLAFATYSNQYKREGSVFAEATEQLGIRNYSYVSSRENIMQMVAQNKAAGYFLHLMSQANWYVANGLIKPLPVRGHRLLPSHHFLLCLDDDMLSPSERRVAGFIRERYALTAAASVAGA